MTQGGKLSVQLIAVDSGELLWGKTYQLNFEVDILQDTYHLNFSNEDYADLVKNVIVKLTGREPAPTTTEKE